MKTPKHTKGPWTNLFNPRGPKGLSHEVWNAERQTLVASELTEANAHLITAAPDMLEALEKIEKTLLEKHQGIENHTYELLLISDALKKARGEIL